MHVQLALMFFLESLITHFYLPHQFSLLVPIAIICFFTIRYFIRKNDIYSQRDNNSKKNVHFILLILFLGTIITLIIPEQFAIGSYNRSLRITDISLIFIPLSLLGFGISLRRLSIPKIVLLFAIITTSVTIITGVNNAFPQFRLLIYFLILIVFGAVKGVKYLYEKLGHFFNNSIPVILILTISIFYLSFIGYNNLSQTHYKSYYVQEDIHSTQIFLNQLHEDEGIIPQKHTITKMPYILRYLRVNEDQIIGNEDLYYFTEFSDFVLLISSKYPDINKAFVYIIERKIGNPTYYTPSIEMLEQHAEKQKIGTITIYSFTI